MKKIGMCVMALLAGLTGGLRAAEPAMAPCDTIRMSWDVEAGEEMSFTFTGKQGGTFVVDWGDRERDWFIGQGDEPITARHTYKESRLFNVCLYGPMWLLENYVDTVLGLNLEMVYVAGGTFTMGKNFKVFVQWYDDADPEHSVTVDGFHMGKFEITQAQWEAVMGTTMVDQLIAAGADKAETEELVAKNQGMGFGDDFPMYYITWDEAVQFCEKLSALTGNTYRLPTEAEWEYAARGGQYNDGTKYAGSDNMDEVGWYSSNSHDIIENGVMTANYVHAVGRKQPNGLDLYDMSGNVSEWCSDWYNKCYYHVSPSVNPQGPENWNVWYQYPNDPEDSFGALPDTTYCFPPKYPVRVYRGGCYSEHYEPYLSVWGRPAASPDTRNSIGLRVVCESYNPNARVITALDASMVYVAGGTFQMGATVEQGEDADDDEKPVHEVTLDGFCIAPTEVTQGQWNAVMGYSLEDIMAVNQYTPYGIGNDYPMYYITLEEANLFCELLSARTGHTYRLPTEAEWEFAARGGNKAEGTKYAGNDNVDDVAWYGEDFEAGGGTHPVRQKLPNGLGLYDMSGNVREWCLDGYDSEYYGQSPSVNPQAPNDIDCVCRGGSWETGASGCRVSARDFWTVNFRYSSLGFRVVREIDDETDPLAVLETLNKSMVPIVGGSFQMGATEEQVDVADDNEKPVHEVTVAGFYIGAYEVTQAQWVAVMGTNPSFGGFEWTANYPVENVSWDDVMEFCEKLSALTGRAYRLPTEAEWEYAARGGQQTDGTMYAGGNTIDEVAWYRGNSNNGGYDCSLQPVGQKQPNGLGLYDMSGNVWEWCLDGYSADFYSKSPTHDPLGHGESRVVRGGGWYENADVCRVSARSDYAQDIQLGFRVVYGGKTMAELVVSALEESMVPVAGGTFQMGATEEQGDEAGDYEKPAHEVTLDSFNISPYVITQAQWKAVMGTDLGWNSDYGVGSEFDCDYPAYYVSWDDAVEFCEKMSALTGHTYRLPTEAEWEYAARGGQNPDGTKYAGSDDNGEVAWYESDGWGTTHKVGQKKPNGLGLYDMSGNVREWCSDWYAWDYYANSPSANPQGPESGSDRVTRGGSWGADAQHCRVSSRYSDKPDVHGAAIGFRIVRDDHAETPKDVVSALEASMVYVEGGTFMMGATEEQGDEAKDNEKPVHEVTLDGFYIGAYEVTQAQWTAVMGTTDRYVEEANGVGDDAPIYNINWEEAVAFCEKLSELTGHTYRLPTEAEWEYAARGGQNPDGFMYPGGCWCSDNSFYVLHSVGTLYPNGLGLYDMGGNVREWCSDWYGAYSDTPVINPQGPEDGPGHVIRGGDWNRPRNQCRVSYRYYANVGIYYIGFRIVREQ